MKTVIDILPTYKEFLKLIKKHKMGYDEAIVTYPEYTVFKIKFGYEGTDFESVGWVVNVNVDLSCGGVMEAIERAYGKCIKYLKEIK